MERSIESAVDMFLLTENSAHKDALNQFFIRGYEGLLYTRSTNREGRIAAYVKRVWSTTALNVFYNCRGASIELYFRYKNVSLLVVYGPHSGSVLGFFKELKANVELLARKERLCLEGDFNIDILR